MRADLIIQVRREPFPFSFATHLANGKTENEDALLKNTLIFLR